MKNFIFEVFGIVVPILIARIPAMKELFKEWVTLTVTTWADKHLTIEEIGNEIDDVEKLIKKIF